ncbi:MAG: lamin tail domain-containing protein, partial [Planctomycetota bacterium]|nr:lamin tail domain-containing protein [Planctomycetota bacterium]
KEPRIEPLEPRLLLDGGPVVINEIHYAPDVKTEPAAFIELYNTGAASVDLTNWKFTDGVLFEFPGGTSIASHGYLVVAQNPATVLSRFGAAAIGPWLGDLSDQGEKIVLRDAANNVADEVDYGLGFPWPTVGDPPGYSIDLVNPSLDNDLGGSWRRSCPEASVQPTALLAAGSSWRYFKGTAEPSSPISAWRQPGFNDSAWPLKPAPIGYGESLVKTDIGSGYSTLYLRTTFNVGNPAQVNTLQLSALYDDGFNVWINGTLALTVDSPSSDPAYTAYALQPTGSTQFETFTLKYPATYLVAGTNTIAVQLLNVTARSNDAFFDGRLLAWPTAAHPTPGAQNAAYAANNPPQVRQVDANPGQPSADQPVRVTAKVTDPDGVASVVLEYQLVDPGAYIAVEDAAYATGWASVAMNDAGAGGDAEAGDGTYTVTLPGLLQTNRRLVRYRITAADALGASVRTPYADDPQPNFAYFVYNGVPAWTGALSPDNADPALAQVVTYDSGVMGQVPAYHLLSKKDSVERATWIDKYGGDLYKWSGTLVYDGVVYDNIHYRARGGVWRYSMGKNMWKFDFNRGHEFQARDDYGNKYDTKWTKLNLGASIQQGDYWHRGEQGMFESVGSQLFNLAGVAAFQTHFAQLRIIDDASEYSTQYDGDFWGLYLAIEQEDGRFLDEHDLPDGNLYKMDSSDADVLPDSNSDGIPDGGGGSLNNQGPAQPSDNSDLIAFVNAYSGATTDQWWRDNLDLASYYSYRSILEAIHHYDNGYGKNYFYYHDPVTNKWQVMPWDLDLTWSDNMYGNGAEPFMSRVLSRAVFALEYKNRMREIRDLLYNTDQAYQLIDEQAAFIDDPGGGLSLVDADRALWDYNPVMVNTAYVNLGKAGQGRFYAGNPPGIVIPAPGGFQGMVQKMKDYVVSRGAWIDATIIADASIPATPTVAYVGPSGSPLNRLAFRSSAYSGTNPFAAMQWRIAEVTDPASPNYDPAAPKQYEINAAWQSGEVTTFAADQTLPAAALHEGRTYRVRVRMKDATGRWSHWSDPVQFIAGDPLPDPLQSLRITELMYHPPDAALTGPEAGHGWVDEDFQFVELANTAAQTLALAGVEFSEGIRFQFPARDLAPGGRVLVVKNQAAFQARYGHACDALIVGEFADGSTLSKGGERVVLYSPAAGAILDFEYEDGWYPHTDGEEFSLVVRSATQDRVLWDQGEGWRASWRAGGSPGEDEP